MKKKNREEKIGNERNNESIKNESVKKCYTKKNVKKLPTGIFKSLRGLSWEKRRYSSRNPTIEQIPKYFISKLTSWLRI